MDIEVSEDLMKYFEDTDIQFKLVPPHMHFRSAAEKALRTFKNHFIDVLCTANRRFPFYLWDRKMPYLKLIIRLCMNGTMLCSRQSIRLQ